MSDEKKNENKDEIEATGGAYSVIVFFSFVMIVASLFMMDHSLVKYSLIWMLAARSYGLLFRQIKREWVAVILYGGALLYYGTQIRPWF